MGIPVFSAIRRISARIVAVWRHLTWLVVMAAWAALAAGCAAMGGLTADTPAAAKEAAVGKRAEERWQAVIRQDFEGAYAYFSPASREVISLGAFTARMSRFQYRTAKTDKVECEAEVCKVSLTLTYDFPPMRMTNVPNLLQESWIIERGQAWFVFRD
jgi:hypothetical protein